MSASSRGYLTTDTLLEMIKTESMVPDSNAALDDDDFLAMANQEMRIGMLPTIMQFHEEYLVRTDTPTALVANQSAYAIPYRAVGGKLREVFYLDTSNNLNKMVRVNPDF